MRYKIIKNPEVAPKLSVKDAKYFGIDITKDENRGVLKIKGPWQIPITYKALAISKKYNQENVFNPIIDEMTIYGQRVLNSLKTSGYKQEGVVSLGNKKHSAFKSSQLFDVEGKLIDVAVIQIRIK